MVIKCIKRGLDTIVKTMTNKAGLLYSEYYNYPIMIIDGIATIITIEMTLVSIIDSKWLW